MNGEPHQARLARVVLAGVLLLALGAGLAFLNPWLDSDGDNAGYLILARSIAQGRGFTSINFPGDIPHTLYHPLYPLTLAPIVALAPGNWLLPKLPSLLYHLLFVAAVWVLFRNRTRPGLWTAALLAAAVAMNRQTAEHAAATMTESLYLALSFAALALAERRSADARGRDGVWMGVLLAASYLTKPVGITLAAALLGAWLLRRHWRATAIAASILTVVIAGWSIRNVRVVTPENVLSHPLYGNVSYGSHVLNRSSYRPELGLATPSMLLDKWRIILRWNVDNVAQVAHPAYTVGLVALQKATERPLWFSLPFVAVMMLGWIRCVRGGAGAGELYTLFYLGAVSFYPAGRVRYVLPVMPLLLYYLVRGADGLLGWLRRRPAHVTGPAGPAGVLVLLTAVALSALLLVRQARFTIQDNSGPHGAENLYDRVDLGASAYVRAVVWIKTHTPPTAVIMSLKPWDSYLISGHPTTVYPFSYEVERTVETIHRDRVDYVIDDSSWHWQTRDFLRPVLKAYPHAFLLVHVEQGPDTTVYQVNRDALPSLGGITPRSGPPRSGGRGQASG